ncbi:MAG: DNA mismatch repair endonuclease MutL [Thermodesulfovibrionaceae bacterium]
MRKISILSESLVGKIAAGEVIERPASVVKELIENSIDAQATSIAVFVKDSGVSEIKVVDDGEGIYQEDATAAFLRHATSKIRQERDLYSITTLGFRGEALYSIAQVSKIRVITQHKDEDVGTELYLTGGKLIEKKPAITKGTTVEVRELFFNVPVRRKFLKSTTTEKSHIVETVQNYCLAYPEIQFSLFIDDEEIFNLPSTNSINERVFQLFGSKFFEKLKFIEVSDENYKLSLFITEEKLSRKPREKQTIFVNRRPIRDSFLVGTLYKAFQIKENHPQFFIYLTVPPSDVDFNVHPAKKEVRFRNPKIIHELIFKTALQTAYPSVDESSSIWQTSESFFNENNLINFFQVDNSIVAINTQEGILFFDFHAAHERINFERILNKSEKKTLNLIFPEVINLSAPDYILIKENLFILKEIGIEAEDFGKNSIVIRAIPEVLKNANLASVIESIAHTLKEEITNPDLLDRKKKIAATVACHKSLRANDKITLEELKMLIKQLGKTSNPEHCPHGRPIKKLLTLNEIRKWFLK